MSKKPFNYLLDKHNQTQNHCTNSDGDKEEIKDYELNAITNAASLKRTNRVKHEDKIKELVKKKQELEMKKQEFEERFKKEMQQIKEQIEEWNNESQQIKESNEEDDQIMEKIEYEINDFANQSSSNRGKSKSEFVSESRLKNLDEI